MPQFKYDTIGKTGAPEEVKEVYRQFDKFLNHPARKKWLKERQEHWKAIIDNEMWEESDKKEMEKTGQIPIVYNKCNKGVQGSSAVVTNNNPEVKALPIGSGDVYVAEILQRGLSYVWMKNKGEKVIYKGVEERQLGGIGIFKISHDTSAGIFGRVVKSSEDPTNFYWSADSKKDDFSDTDVIEAHLRTEKYISENYPELKKEEYLPNKGIIVDDTGKLTDTKTSEDNYAVDPDKSDSDAFERTDPKNIWEIEAWMLKTEMEDWVVFQYVDAPRPQAAKIELKEGQTAEEFFTSFTSQKDVKFAHSWRRKVKKRILRIIVGTKLIEQTDETGKTVKERENPFGVDADANPIMAIIPFHAQRTLTSYSKPPSFYALPLNKALNKKEAQLLHAVAKSISSPVIMPQGAKWVGPPDKPGSYIQMSNNAAFQPNRLPAGNVDISRLALAIAHDTEAIHDQYDLQDVTRGKLPEHQSDVSGRAVLALQDLNGVMVGPALGSLEDSITSMAKTELAIMFKHWPRFMWERLLEDDEYETFIPTGDTELTEKDPEETEKYEIRAKWDNALNQISSEDPGGESPMKVLDLDVKTTAGSSMPTNRMARAQVAMEFFGVGLYDRKAALEYADDPKAAEISNRMDKAEAAAAEAEAKKG